MDDSGCRHHLFDQNQAEHNGPVTSVFVEKWFVPVRTHILTDRIKETRGGIAPIVDIVCVREPKSHH